MDSIQTIEYRRNKRHPLLDIKNGAHQGTVFDNAQCPICKFRTHQHNSRSGSATHSPHFNPLGLALAHGVNPVADATDMPAGVPASTVLAEFLAILP